LKRVCPARVLTHRAEVRTMLGSAHPRYPEGALRGRLVSGRLGELRDALALGLEPIEQAMAP
jgi:hypothetical protein